MFPKAAFLLTLAASIHALPRNATNTTSPDGSIPHIKSDPVMTKQLEMAQREVDWLQKSFKLDTQKPPFGLTEIIYESSCFMQWTACPSIGMFYKDIMKMIQNITVEYKGVVEARGFNPTNSDTVVTSMKSNALTIARTAGWSIGASVSGGINQHHGSGSATFSFQYSESTTEEKTHSKFVTVSTPCKPRSMCLIETRTFYAKIKGKCKREPMVDCRGHRNQCNRKEDSRGYFKWSYCAQTSSRIQEYCRDTVLVDCEVSVPIFEDDGETPRSTIVPMTYEFEE
ncbi:hypothetical protein LOZ41_003765 [Ophidiomyces ophidiicola]|nr:hypothetical protein LOZ41_003765 [Ophidiomyces ophidiicola]